MTVDQLSVDLVLNDSKFAGRLDAAGGKVSKFGGLVSALPGPLGNAASSVQGLAGGFAGLGTAGTVAVAGLAAAVAGIGAAAVKVGLDWEAAEGTIRAGTGATGADLEALTASAQGVFADVPQSAGEAATAIADLSTRTGLTGTALEELATQTLNLSRVTGGDLQGTIAATTRAFGDWGIESAKAAEANDFLFKTSQTTGIGVEQLANSVVRVGAPLRELGFSFEQAAALMAKWEQEGVNTETMMSGLRQAVKNFALENVPAAEGMRQVQEAILAAGTEAEQKAIAFRVFGQEAGVDFVDAIKGGKLAVDDLVASISASGETINKAAEDTRTLGDRFGMLTGKLGLLLEPLGSGLVGAANGALDAIMGFGESIGSVVTGVGVFIDELAATNEGFAVAVNMTKFAANAIGKGLKAAFDAAAAAVGWLGDKVAALWNFFKQKGEKATEDLAEATKDAATETKNLGREAETAKTAIEKAEQPTKDWSKSSQDLARELKASEKAATDAAREYANLEPEARAAAMGVELFATKAGESPVKIDGMAQAARDAADDLNAAHDSGELVAPTIEWVGTASSDATPLVQGLADAALNVSTNVGLAKSATDEWLNSQNAANLEALKTAGALENIGFEAGKLAKPGGQNSLVQVSTVITDLGDALVDTLLGEGSFLGKAKSALLDFGEAILRGVVEEALNPLIDGLTGLLDFDFSGLGSKLGGLFGLGGGGGAAAGAAGGGGGLGGLTSLGGPWGALAMFGGSLLGNLLGGPDMDAVNLNTLSTGNEVANLRRDQWQQHNEVLAKWDIAQPTWWDTKDGINAIVAALGGGIVVSGYSGEAQQQDAQATQQGVSAAAPDVGAQTAAAITGTPARSRAGNRALGPPSAMDTLQPGGGATGLPGRSRTGQMQSDPVYTDQTALMDRNPLAVAAAQAGNVLASLATGGLFAPEATAAVQDTTEAVNATTTEVRDVNDTIRAGDAETNSRISTLTAAVQGMIASIRQLASRPVSVQLDGRELALALGPELDAIDRALA